MRFLISGSTGFIGKKLVTNLLNEGHEVRALSRRPETVRKLFGGKVRGWEWEASHKPVPRESLEGVDSVIHLAGEGIADKRWTEARKKEIYDSRIDGTRVLVNAMLSQPVPPKSFVCASGVGFYGDRGDEILNENSKPGSDFLAKVCVGWEREAFAAKAKIRTCALRTGMVLGRDGGALKKLLPLFKLGLGGPVGNGRQWVSWIQVDDLVRLYIEAAGNSVYHGAVNAVAPNPVTNAQFSYSLGKAVHRPAFLPAPAFAVKLAMGELAVLVLSSQRALPDFATSHRFAFNFQNAQAALDALCQGN